MVGESGSGKSVSVLALLGLLPGQAPRSTGSAAFEGRDLLAMSETQLRTVRGNGIGMVFQDPMTSLNPVLTVGRQLTEGMRAHRKVPSPEGGPRTGGRAARRRRPARPARGALDRVPARAVRRACASAS